MSRLWKGAFLVLMVFGLVWLATLWRWQTEAVDISTGDIITRLLLLPLGVLAVLWLLMWVGGRWGPAAARTAQPSLPTQADSPSPGAGADDEVRRFSVAVLDAAVCLNAGHRPREVFQQVCQRAVWPQLDDTLRDVEGNNVFTARIDDLDLPPPEATGGGDADPERVQRARAALWRLWQPLSGRLSDALSGLQPPPEPEPEPGHPATPAAASARPAHLAGLPAPRSPQGAARRAALHVVLALPPSWTPPQRQAVLADLQALAAPLQADSAASLAWHWQLLPPEAFQEDDGVWRWMDALMLTWARHQDAVSVLLLAADSGLDDEAIEQRQGRGELFTAMHQQGRVPGEGAAALWLASPAWMKTKAVSDTHEGAPAVRLHRPCLARRQKSADAQGRVGSSDLQAALRDALDLARIGTPGCVVSDGDHRASRTAELLEALTEVSPEVDPAQAVCRLGDVCGDLGVVGTLAPVAVAAGVLCDQVLSEAGNVGALAICQQSPHHRVVLGLGAWSDAPSLTSPEHVA